MGLLGSEDAGVGSIPTAAGPDSPGVTPPDVDYLNAIYTAGLGDPATHNVFPMATGNLRFWGSTGSGEYPNAGFFESSTTPGDGRVPAWYTRRYYRTASSIGGFEGDAFVGFDPLWDGSFTSLNDFTITADRAAFTSSTDEQAFPTLYSLGMQQYICNQGFFDGAITYPTPGNNPGGRVRLDTYLRNTIDNFARRHSVTGWGQIIGYPDPQAAGITAQLYSAVDFSNAPAADGNGVGWMIGYGAGDPLPDPPVAMIEAHMLDHTTPNGAWGWGLWARNSLGVFGQIAEFDWTNGAVFNVVLKFTTGAVAPGTTAVTISNSPGASGAPVEYLTVKTASGTRYIPLLA